MSAIRTIYKLKPQFTVRENDIVCVIRTDNKQIYGFGKSRIHPDDIEFQSEIVGKNIALSRARLDALISLRFSLETEYNIKKSMYNDIFREYGSAGLAFDSYDSKDIWRDNIQKTKQRLEKANKAIKKERAYLKNYLFGLNKAHSSIKRSRLVQKDENE